MKSERGQSAVLFGLLLILVIGAAVLAFSGSLPGMKEGADTIGESMAEGIENAVVPIDDLTIEGLTFFWVNSQKLTPNAHALQNHADTAWQTTECYNNNGAFAMWRIGNREFHLLCLDDDGFTVRNIMLERESNTSNRFHMKNAFTRDDPSRAAVEVWLKGKRGEQVMRIPKDMIIIIDNIIP
jgi:hypothetical protein